VIRQLRLVVRTVRTGSGAVPLLVAASVMGGEACSTTPENSQSGASAGVPSAGGEAGTAGAGGSAGSAGALGAGGNTIILPDAGLDDAGLSRCPGADVYVIELPPEGVPAEPGQICTADEMPVEAWRAARVTFDAADSRAPGTASGAIEIPESLRGSVIGTPVVEVIDASHSWLRELSVDNIEPSTTGYTFDASWPNAAAGGYAIPRMTVRTTLEIRCDDRVMTVHAVTDVHLCDIEDGFEWASSGDRCSVCRIIAEMAPSPIVPDKRGDDLPLSQALRLRLVELARVSNTVVLWAENDAGDGAEYEWHASHGRVEHLAPDVVAWTLEEGMASPQIQVAVCGASAAAAVSFAFNAEAA
jgi:hypothetical protein